MRKFVALLSIALLAGATAAFADGVVKTGTERSITLPVTSVALKEGAGMEIARGYCAICHSLDYITTQQKFPRAKWQAEVTKMIKVYGAPINEANAKIIADYIATAYGKGD